MGALTKVFDEEKQEIYSEMAVLRANAEKYETMKEAFEKHLFWYKWLFISKVRSLKDQIEGEDPEKRMASARIVEQEFFDREMARLGRMNGAAFAQLKDDVRDAREEANEYCQKVSALEFEVYSLKKETEALQDKLSHITV